MTHILPPPEARTSDLPPEEKQQSQLPGLENGHVNIGGNEIHVHRGHTVSELYERFAARRPSLQDRLEWIRSVEEKYTEELLKNDYLSPVLALLGHLRDNKNFPDAATLSGFTSRDLTECPPAAKARIVLESLLEKNDRGLLKEFRLLFPEKQPSELLCHAPWVQECKDKKNFLGRCWKMSSANHQVVEITHDNDRGTVSARIPNGVKDSQIHTLALQKAVHLLQEGALQVLEPTIAQKAGIRIEPGLSGNKYLVTLHCQCDSRIYGIYDSDTGEIVWQDIVPDHAQWKRFLHSHGRK